MLVPVQYQRILTAPGFSEADLTHFKMKMCTGAPMKKEIKQELLPRWPGRCVELYGQTEGGCTTVLEAGAYPEKQGSVGKPAAGVEIRILDERDEVLPEGQIGEIAGRATSMMLGYHRSPELTNELIWRDGDGTVFYRTGDLGYLDPDGFLHLRGRKKDIIISGGLNINASDIEALLDHHQAVLESAVIAIPSDEWGETPLAIVVLRKGSEVFAPDLLRFANQRLEKVQRLSGVVVVDYLPRNAAGKVVKRELCRQYGKQH